MHVDAGQAGVTGQMIQMGKKCPDKPVLSALPSDTAGFITAIKPTQAVGVRAVRGHKIQKSLIGEARRIEQAIELIRLGARMQLLETETPMSYERLLQLYKEVAGKSPSKGQLPFSTDWFMSWGENIHASLFANIHAYLIKASDMEDVDALIKAYKLYVEQVSASGMEAHLSVTRAWRLMKFLENSMLQMTPCSTCGGHFVTHPHEIVKHFVCGICSPPARAGHGSKHRPAGAGPQLKKSEVKAMKAEMDARVAKEASDKQPDQYSSG